MKTSERHVFVFRFKEKYPVKTMCRTLKISESGYYRRLRNRNNPTKQQLLLVEIKQILTEHPDNSNYGYRRMRTALEDIGIMVSNQTVYRTMKAGGLLHKQRKPHGLTKAGTEIQGKESLIKLDFRADKPMRKLLTDITEVQCADGKLYISAILDCYNGEIVALEMRDNMKKELCIDTVRQIGSRLDNVILHSDRGSQYTSEAFRKELKKRGIIQSLSGTGRCYDNARMESFFATLKKGKIYQIPAYRMSRAEVKTIIFRYIYGYYNQIRINTSNPGGLAPAQYKAEYERAKSAAAIEAGK